MFCSLLHNPRVAENTVCRRARTALYGHSRHHLRSIAQSLVAIESLTAEEHTRKLRLCQIRDYLADCGRSLHKSMTC